MWSAWIWPIKDCWRKAHCGVVSWGSLLLYMATRSTGFLATNLFTWRWAMQECTKPRGISLFWMTIDTEKQHRAVDVPLGRWRKDAQGQRTKSDSSSQFRSVRWRKTSSAISQIPRDQCWISGRERSHGGARERAQAHGWCMLFSDRRMVVAGLSRRVTLPYSICVSRYYGYVLYVESRTVERQQGLYVGYFCAANYDMDR